MKALTMGQQFFASTTVFTDNAVSARLPRSFGAGFRMIADMASTWLAKAICRITPFKADAHIAKDLGLPQICPRSGCGKIVWIV